MNSDRKSCHACLQVIACTSLSLLNRVYYTNLVISLLRSVTVPDPFRKTVISADVSLRFRIFDIKSGSIGGGPATEAAEVSFLERPPPNVRPRSASVPRRPDSAEL